MADHTNLENYADPILFDTENSYFEPDGPFYLSLAQQVRGSVLELGCGTGRITIPLARHGINMTGLDIVPGMLARARSKAGDLPIQWVEADARDFHLGKQFSLICAPGFVFEHLLERPEQEAMLACVREYLAVALQWFLGSSSSWRLGIKSRDRRKSPLDLCVQKIDVIRNLN